MKKFRLSLLVLLPLFLVGCNGDPSPVTPPPSDPPLILSETRISIMEESSYRLQAMTTSHKLVFWSSVDEEIATVSDDGIVYACLAGTTSIVAKCGTSSAVCNVTVLKYDAPSTFALSIEKREFNLNVEDVFLLPVVAHYGSEIVSPEYTLSIDNSDVVSNVGLMLYALSKGQANIIINATYLEQNFKLSIIVNVI